MEPQSVGGADLARDSLFAKYRGLLGAHPAKQASSTLADDDDALSRNMRGSENETLCEDDPDERRNRFDRPGRPSSPSPIPSLASTTPSLRGCSPPTRFFMTDEEERPRIATPVQDSPQKCYSYATIQETEFRLLRLAPGKADETVQGALKIMPIERIRKSKFKFQALSYAWGEGSPDEIVMLEDIPATSDKGMAKEDADQDSEQEPLPFPVRKTLHQALKRIREPDHHIWIWVDAICIDQSNDSEKSHQLPKMIDIYSNTWNVTIWLGEYEDAKDDPPLAMDFLPKILNLASLDMITAKEGIDENDLVSWKAFASLIGRSWFCRRWVIQEVAYAKRLSIRCGERIVSWIDFADAVELFLDKLDRIRELYSESRLSRTDPDALQHVESSGARALVRMSRNVFRKTSKGDVVARLWDIETLVLNSVYFGTQDSRDVVYGLLSLASDAPVEGDLENQPGTVPAVFVPDYSKKPRDVLIDFVEYIIDRTCSLDIICRHWALGESESDTRGFPSWIGLVINSKYGGPMLGTGRINGESLVGKPGERIYNASRGVKICAKLEESEAQYVYASSETPALLQGSTKKRTISETDLAQDNTASSPAKRKLVARHGDQDHPLEDQSVSLPAPQISQIKTAPRFNGILEVKGITLGVIRQVSSRVIEGTIPEDALKILGWEGSLDEGIDDSIWRTLVADRGLDGNIAPSWYRRACAVALTKTSPEGDLNTTKLMQSKTQSECVVEYLRRVQTVVWGRKLFSTDGVGNRRLVGLGSRFVREGDTVCILFGCSVPVILRHHPRRPRYRMPIPKGPPVPIERKITLIGECYIHGMMEGEAFAGMSQAQLEARTTGFRIS